MSHEAGNAMPNCQECRESIAPGLRGELGDAECHVLEAHLAQCPACRATADGHRAVLRALPAAAVAAPEDLTDKLFAAMLLERNAAPVSPAPELTDRTMDRVLNLRRVIRRIFPLHVQFIHSTFVACLLATLLVWAFEPVMAYTEDQSDADICAANLRTMGRVVRAYPQMLDDSREIPLESIRGALAGYFQEHPEELRGMIDVRQIGGCPGSDRVISYHSAALTPAQMTSSLPASIPIVWCRCGSHEDGRNVLFLDGSVQFMNEGNFLRMRAAIRKSVLMAAVPAESPEDH